MSHLANSNVKQFLAKRREIRLRNLTQNERTPGNYSQNECKIENYTQNECKPENYTQNCTTALQSHLQHEQILEVESIHSVQDDLATKTRNYTRNECILESSGNYTRNECTSESKAKSETSSFKNFASSQTELLHQIGMLRQKTFVKTTPETSESQSNLKTTLEPSEDKSLSAEEESIESHRDILVRS